MARVNVFIEAFNETRHVSIGGKHRNDSGGCWLNTDTAAGSRDLSVRAAVVGSTNSRDRRKYGDTREAQFEIELPEAGGCDVTILAHGGRMAKLVEMGALLVMMQGACLMAGGKTDEAERRFEFTRETLAELEAAATKDLPPVTLPGGVTLAHALACVEMCKHGLPNAAIDGAGSGDAVVGVEKTA